MKDELSIPKRRRDREVWVGLLVILGVASVLGLLFAITDPAMLRGRFHVTLVIADAMGIHPGDPVQMRGVNIGRVGRLAMAPEGVAIELEIERGYPVPADSHGVVRPANILGEVAVDIIPGSSTEPLRPGDTLRGRQGVGLVGRVQDVATEVSGALARIQALLSERTVENVESATADLVQVLAELRQLAVEARELTRDVDLAATRIAGIAGAPELERALASLDEVTAKLAHVMDVFGRTGTSVGALLSRIERGEGSLGRLAHDDQLYVEADTALQNINSAAVELARLAADIRKNPGRYFRISVF